MRVTVGAVDRNVTVLTRLISGLGQIVERRDAGVALETELRDTATPQLPGIGGAVGLVAGHAAIQLSGRVGEDKRTGLLGVAVDAGAALRQQIEAALAVLTVHRVAVGAGEVSGAVAVGKGHLELTGD